MKVGERGGAALVIFDQSSKPRGPSEGTLHHPSSGQENKAALGLGQFDDAEFDAVLSGGGPGGFPGIALIDEGDFDVRLDRDSGDRSLATTASAPTARSAIQSPPPAPAAS